MPIPASTVSGTMCRTLTRHVLPSLHHRLTGFCTGTRASAGLIMTAPGLLCLFGKSDTSRLVGATLLNSVLRRSSCNFLTKSSDAVLLSVAMIEPWATLIRTIQPDLLKTGFIKIHENEHVMTFTDGTNKVDFTVTDRHFHPTLVGYFITRNGEHFSLASLRDKLNSPETRKQEFLAVRAVNEQYGLWDCNTPQAIRDEGYRAGVLLNLKQTVTFLEQHKQTLAEFGMDNEWD